MSVRDFSVGLLAVFISMSFNPCFSGCRSAIGASVVWTIVETSVSILVLVDVGPRSNVGELHCPNNIVSILVLVDVGPRLKHSILVKQIEECFNPCFSGCRSAILPTLRCSSRKQVSILVLVDVGPRYVTVENVQMNNICFNPCFSGCRSAILWSRTAWRYYKNVSILVLVDVGPRSLEIAQALKNNRFGFNPCFSGCRSAMLEAMNGSVGNVGFNPCFSGCRSAILDITAACCFLFCFNPCFSGCRSAINIGLLLQPQHRKFQSLF